MNHQHDDHRPDGPGALRAPLRHRSETASVRPRPTLRLRALTAAGLAVVVVAATFALAAGQPAGASTLDGVATIASPGDLSPLLSGGSATPFSVALPPNAACSGDTASDGYHVYSYLVQSGVSVPSVTFVNTPSVGYGLVDNTGLYYGPVNTAIGTGQIVGIPENFEWAPLVTVDDLLPELLYSGGTSGVWEAGIACADTTGAVSDYWNTEVTFTSSGSDPNGFVWSAVPGPIGSAVPAITSAASTSFSSGSAGTFTVTTTGSPAPSLTESGALPAGVTFVDHGDGTATLGGTTTASGSYPLTLTASNGIGPDATQAFTLDVAPPGPAVTALSPTAGPEAGGNSVTITGTGLADATSVLFGSTAATVTADSATSVTATAPAGTGTVDVTVTTPSGTSPVSAADRYTYEAAPAVTALSPTSGAAAGGTTVTIAGTGLAGATSVHFGSTAATVTADSATSVTATAPAGTGTVDVTVTTAAGTSPTSGADLYTFVARPAVTALSPTSGPAAGGTTVTITGTGLDGATSVHFGSTAATVTADSATSVTVTAPAGTGTVDVTVTTAGGTSPTSGADRYLFEAAPAITSADSAAFTVGVHGSFTVAATGNPPPTITGSGTLPAGVSLVGGVLSGTPQAAGTFPLVLTAANGVGTDATQDFTLTVRVPVLAVTAGALPTAKVGTAYAGAVAATGGVPPYSWAVTAGTLPAGLHLDASTGALSGTPTAAGSRTFTVTVTDAAATTASRAESLTVAPAAMGGGITQPVVGIASTPSGDGYWVVDRAGHVSAHGGASFFGSTGALHLNAPIVRLVPTADGQGYWLVASDGGVFAFGDAAFHGSLGGVRLNGPVVGLVPATGGRGYWLVASDGGVFTFGDAAFRGSLGAVHLNRPIVGGAADPATGGYWLVASDGGVFSFGAPFYGSTGALHLVAPVVAMAPAAGGHGYTLAASDGGVFTFGRAAFHGSGVGLSPGAPVTGIAADPATGGYWLVSSTGGVFSFGAPFHGAQ